MSANAGINKAPNQYPVWMAQAVPVKAQRAPVQAQGMDTIPVPRALVMAGAAASLAVALVIGSVFGYMGAQPNPTTQSGTVSYATQSTVSDQRGPVRQPNPAEVQAYGMALETAHGVCSLEWHGMDGGTWETVCQGPNSH